MDLSKAISRKRCKIAGKLVLITNRKSYVSFRLAPKSVILNDLERRNGPYFALFHQIRVRCRRKTITRPIRRFQNLLFIIYYDINTICAIIQRVFGQNKLITQFGGRRCIDD